MAVVMATADGTMTVIAATTRNEARLQVTEVPKAGASYYHIVG
jgi:hypothetical protein